MLIQVDKVESVYVDLKSVILSPDLGLWDHLENGDLSPRLWGSSHSDAKDDNERLKRTYSPNQPL
jgi:hypothetical protein